MRMLYVVFILTQYFVVLSVRIACDMLLGRGKTVAATSGYYLAQASEKLGGAFLKAAQILSTRVDLLPPAMVTQLARLRDNADPLSIDALSPIVSLLNVNKSMCINPIPLASATIAQVHVGKDLITGEQFALKVRRPGVASLLKADARYIRFLTRSAAALPWLRKYPITEAISDVCIALANQSDFGLEINMQKRFRNVFRDDPNIKIPEIDELRSREDVISMELLEGYRPMQAYRAQRDISMIAVQTGLRALYKMIFIHGLIHCDLHGGNILCNDYGRVALLDFGFVSEMSHNAKCDFAEFFLSIAFRDGKTAARISRETALRVSGSHNPLDFERDLQVLLDMVSGRKADEFQVARFVTKLFQIQRRHGIYGSPSFTLPILSLLTYEGLIKDLYPEVDFQQEAVPFVVASLRPNRATETP